jgi:hypothetical protein
VYRFCFVFYNRKDNRNPDPPKRPLNITESDWIQINMDCPDPDNLQPCPLYGFDELHVRDEKHREVINELDRRTKLIRAKLCEMMSFCDTELHERFQRICRGAEQIIEQLKDIFEYQEVQNNQGSKGRE